MEKYVEAVRLYRTTSMSAAQIAKQTGVSKKGFYGHLQKWHLDLVCQRKNIPYEEGRPMDWSKIRKYNPATKAKYAEAIAKLKEHEPELHARQGMVRTDKGGVMSHHSMEKYGEVVHLYATTSESLKSLARRFGVNDCSLRDFIKRHFPEAFGKHQEQVRQQVEQAE